MEGLNPKVLNGSRRRLLKCGLGAAISTLAGCGGGSDASSPLGSAPVPAPTPAPTPPPAVLRRHGIQTFPHCLSDPTRRSTWRTRCRAAFTGRAFRSRLRPEAACCHVACSSQRRSPVGRARPPSAQSRGDLHLRDPVKRRDFLFRASTALAATLTGCGGTSEATSAAPVPSPSPTPAPAPTPSSPSAPWVPSGPGLSTLALYPAQSGTFPYLATAYPLEGAVPSGQTVESPEDPSLSASVLSRWPDGSASVVVLAGETLLSAGQQKQITLRAATRNSSPLTPARVGQLVTSISCDFGAAGTAAMADFASPERVWWANDRVICARYRLPVGSAGLEAVIDIHAFSSNRAFVEVVVENCKLDPANPSSLSDKSYAAATIVVNGSTIVTVGNPMPGVDTGTGNTYFANRLHERHRAWYCSAWVGGAPGIQVTHDTTWMQGHPLFFKCVRTSNQNFSSLYGAHVNYAPWYVGDYRAGGMGGTGDHPQIGALTLWENQYLQSGNKEAARVVIANALAVLSFNVNYRDGRSGLVPTLDQTAGRNRSSGTWPELPGSSFPSWETAHSPSVGVMAFLCHPSPCFIEIAQKVAVWNCTWYDSSGVLGKYFQPRGQAWGMRALGHAIFLTPTAVDASVSAWRAAAQNASDARWHT